MAESGQLCESGACVDPWAFGSPQWSGCPDEMRATPETMAEKAAYYDDIASRLHTHPNLGWIMSVRLDPGVSEAAATFDDVEAWRSGENDGLWNGLYIASQAYRYAVTRSDEALSVLRTLMDAQEVRMRITGVPGIFTRQYIPPGIDGIACPTDDSFYVEDLEKDDNTWVQVRDDGCIWNIDLETMEWTQRSACGLDEFAGYCWLENVSKDEYAGHMFGLGAVYKLVDDADLNSRAVRMLEQVGDHMMRNDLQLLDWDGRITEHGRFSPLGFDDFPGFNAAMAMSFILMAAEASGRADLRDYYDRCLLRRTGDASDCFPEPAPRVPFTEFFPTAGMYIGPEGCGSNFNNISMHQASLHHLVWFERDAEIREIVQRSYEVDVFRAPDEPRAAMNQNNTWFDFMWAGQKPLGPNTDGPDFAAVQNGICMLRQFPASQAVPDQGLPMGYGPYCLDRFDRDVAETARETADRCPGTFLWWEDPYSLRTCTADDREIRMPTDYLLAYWMGRYYGFIDETS